MGLAMDLIKSPGRQCALRYERDLGVTSGVGENFAEVKADEQLGGHAERWVAGTQPQTPLSFCSKNSFNEPFARTVPSTRLSAYLEKHPANLEPMRLRYPDGKVASGFLALWEG
jgi:hypothetical protein